jgi:hypothetical protein
MFSEFTVRINGTNNWGPAADVCEQCTENSLSIKAGNFFSPA